MKTAGTDQVFLDREHHVADFKYPGRAIRRSRQGFANGEFSRQTWKGTIFGVLSVVVSDNRTATMVGWCAGIAAGSAVTVLGANPIAGLAVGYATSEIVEGIVRAAGIGSSNKPANSPESPSQSDSTAAGPNPHGGEIEPGGRPNPHGGEIEPGGRPNPHGGEIEPGGRPNPHGGEIEPGGRPNPHGGEIEPGGRPNPHGGG